jgi:hypothetical protein
MLICIVSTINMENFKTSTKNMNQTHRWIALCAHTNPNGM